MTEDEFNKKFLELPNESKLKLIRDARDFAVIGRWDLVNIVFSSYGLGEEE